MSEARSGNALSSARSSGLVDHDAAVIVMNVAQRIWGWGNLSPLDDVFGSLAVIKLTLTRNSKFGLIAARFGNRLQRFSKEVGLWVDAFESEPRHLALQKEKQVKCTLKPWNADEALLGAGKFTELAIFEASQITNPVSILSRQCAKGLKVDGRLFLADLMLPDEDGDSDAWTHLRLARPLQSKSNLRRALAESGLKIEEELDLTFDVAAKIRHGLVAIADLLVDARNLDEPQRRVTRAALASQVETWARTAAYLHAGQLSATGLLARKP
jgi:hypothetical protein